MAWDFGTCLVEPKTAFYRWGNSGTHAGAAWAESNASDPVAVLDLLYQVKDDGRQRLL